MKCNIIYIFLIVSISGVIGDDSGIIINNKNHSDIPTASTVPNDHTMSTSDIPTTMTTSKPAPTTTTTTTTPIPTTTTHSSTTSVSPPTSTTNHTPTTSVTTSTSSKPTITTSTESTTTVPTTAPSHKGRKFDGPSFIGGIILASGLMAICFVSWKFYKARTERNYHTL